MANPDDPQPDAPHRPTATPRPEPLDDHGTTRGAEENTAVTSSGERTEHSEPPGSDPAEASRRARSEASHLEPGAPS